MSFSRLTIKEFSKPCCNPDRPNYREAPQANQEGSKQLYIYIVQTRRVQLAALVGNNAKAQSMNRHWEHHSLMKLESHKSQRSSIIHQFEGQSGEADQRRFHHQENSTG